MKKYFFVFCLLCPIFAKSQIISTIAGGGSGGDGSIATSAYINDPTWVVFDNLGNYFIVEGLGNKIRKIDGLTNIISTYAGTGSSGSSADGGLATATNFGGIGSCNFDSSFNYLYIANGGNNKIRQINATTNIVATTAGNGLAGFGGDGFPASSAKLEPNDVCFDRFGNTFICDVGNQRIRKIDKSGIITTYAGNGIPGFSGDGIVATDAELDNPRGIAADNSGNLYITDGGRVRKVDTFGIITTIAGNTVSITFNGDEIPATAANLGAVRVAIHDDKMYLSDFHNNRIRMIETFGMIHTVAGNGNFASTGDDGEADSAALYGPSGIAFDTCGNLYITEVNGGRIRKVTFNPSCGPLKEKNISEQDIKIYPNPATDNLTIEGAKGGETYVLLNILGIIEQSGTLKTGTNKLPIHHLPPGIKILQITTGETQVRKRFVKE